ncbi:MAG: spermidine synthase [Pseudomonadota bacterium]|nr:spermidine synthase [Pseudomonadota bacterium]
MPRPWTTVDRVDTPEGLLELRQRGPKDFVIVIDGRVLMSSTAVRTERAVAEVACSRLTSIAAPRVLIGGLGMAFTLRAALDSLPAAAQVTVVEMNPVVEGWCRGPLAEMTGRALEDPRTTLVIGDVAQVIATSRAPALWHAIILDLYEGPHTITQSLDDPFYGARALTVSRRALLPGGYFTVWSEERDPEFEERLLTVGFKTERVPPPPSGPRHHVYLARVPAPTAPPAKSSPGSRPRTGAPSGRRQK